MIHLVIGIPTYKRPIMLRKCLNSIIENQIDAGLLGEIDILVVDNDVELSAKEVVFDIQSNVKKPFCIQYNPMSDRGLSRVRNEILTKAINLDSDFIIFIDDDEFASKMWLNELIEKAVNLKADMVLGRVIPVFEKKINEGLKYWFKYPNFRDGISIDFLITHNLIIRSQFIIDNALSFDLRFNITGGEDSFFGIQALNKGAKVFFARYALVYETIPEKKSNLKWLIKRYFRVASTFIHVLKLEKKYILLFKKFLVSIVYLIMGIPALFLLFFPIKFKFWGVIKISESIGGFAGIININYQEYKN